MLDEIFSQVSKSAPLATKDVDDVLGGKDAWKNVDQTSGNYYITWFDCRPCTIMLHSLMPIVWQPSRILHANPNQIC